MTSDCHQIHHAFLDSTAVTKGPSASLGTSSAWHLPLKVELLELSAVANHTPHGGSGGKEVTHTGKGSGI